MDPEACTPIRDQTRFTQLAEMTGHVRLGGADSVCELAHAKLVMFKKEEQTAKTRVMGKCREEGCR